MKAKLTGLSILTLTVALLMSCDPGVRWNPQGGGPDRTGAWEPTPHGPTKEQEEETQRNFDKLYAKRDVEKAARAKLDWQRFSAEVKQLTKTARQTRNGWLHGIWAKDCTTGEQLVGYKITDGKHVMQGMPELSPFQYQTHDIIWSNDELKIKGNGEFHVHHKLSDRHFQYYVEKADKTSRYLQIDYYRCE